MGINIVKLGQFDKIPFEELRKENNLSAYDFETSYETIRQLEIGVRNPYMRTVEKYLKELGYELLVSDKPYYHGILLDLVKEKDLKRAEIVDLTGMTLNYLQVMRNQSSSPRYDKFMDMIYGLGHEIKIRKVKT